MKHLKFLIFSLAFTAFLFSCEEEKDPCDGIVCQNGGTCVEGECTDCNVGYEGELCATLSRDKLVGEVNFRNICSNGGADENYDASITAHTDDTKFNMVLLGNNIIYEMTGENTFTYVSGWTGWETPNFISGTYDPATGLATIRQTFQNETYDCTITLTPL